MLGMEETVIFQDTKLEEIKKYFVNISFSEKDRAMYLIKKSYPSQKLYFASHLNCYLTNKAEHPLLKQILNIIIEHIDLWDSNTCIAFSSSLCGIMTGLMISKTSNDQYLDREDKEICIICLTHFIKAIITMEKKVSDGYLDSLSKFINTIRNKQLLKLKPTEEINSMVLQLGKIGQNPYNIKYALFFIACLVGISSEYQEELFECFTSLIHEKQKDIKYEIAYDLRFIFKETDIGYIKSNYYPIIKSYLNENDIILKEIILETLFSNISICDISIKKQMYNSLDEIYSCHDSYTIATDFQHLNNIFISMIECFYENTINDNNQNNEGIDYHSLIVLYLKKFLIQNEKRDGDSSSSNDSFESNSDRGEQYNINYLFKIFDKVSKALIYFNDLLFLNCCFSSLLNQVNSKNEADFFNSIDKVLRHINSNLIDSKKLIIIFDFLKKEDTNDNLKHNSNNHNTSIIGFCNNSFHYSKFNKVIDIMKDNSNDQFFLMLFGTSCHITKLINNLSPNWRNQLSIITSFSSSVLFYIMNNYHKFPYRVWFKELSDITKNYLLLDNVNYVLVVECAKLLARLSKHMTNKDDVINFVNQDILNNQSFYKRRLVCSFIEECFCVLSLELFEEMKLGEHIIKLMDGKTNILKCWAIKFVKNNNFKGDWVKVFKEKVDNLKTLFIEIEDEELKKEIELFISINENYPYAITTEDDLKRREEERVIKEIEILAQELKKRNTNNNHNHNKDHKKPTIYKKISNTNTNTNLRPVTITKGKSQKSKKSLAIKTSDDQMAFNPIPSISISASTNKQKTKSSSTLYHNFEEKKYGKTPIIENPKRKRLNTLGNHKNS